MQPDLDNRHRDIDERVARKYGSLPISTLRAMFDHQFAPLCEPGDTLSACWNRLDPVSLATLRGAVADQGGQDPHLPRP